MDLKLNLINKIILKLLRPINLKRIISLFNFKIKIEAIKNKFLIIVNKKIR